MKRPLGINVDDAARSRLRKVFEDFPQVYLSFSGGKDSGVLLNMALEVAREMGRLPLDVMLVDLEAQYQHTIEYVRRMFDNPDVRGHWICLPLNLRNSVSQYQPFWMCWNPDVPDRWVRAMPDHPSVISDESFFPFFRRGMEFEEFVPEYGAWMVNQTGERTACLIAIRTDESLNRFRTISSETKGSWEGLKWTTDMGDGLYSAYPIYDWAASDVWTANGKYGWDYNRVYDLMDLAGLTLHQMRLCQPYGDDQRRGLWLYKILEPETWSKVVARVEGANFGSKHAHQQAHVFGDRKVHLPEGHDWESYSRLLLATMPAGLRRHYIEKINTYFRWWAWHCKGRERRSTVIQPDDQYDDLGIYTNPAIPYDGYKGEGPDTPAWRDPLWKRVCRVLMKNDYWCKGLGFQQTKRERERMQGVLMEVLRART